MIKLQTGENPATEVIGSPRMFKFPVTDPKLLNVILQKKVTTPLTREYVPDVLYEASDIVFVK